MKCSNCGNNLNGSLCLNCGTTNNYDYSNNNSNSNNSNKKPFKLNKNIKIISLVLLLFVIVGGSYLAFSKPKIVDLSIQKNTGALLDEDFNNNTLSKNDYVLYNTYLVYDNSKLPKKYKTNQFQTAPDISRLYHEYYNDLDSYTKEYVSSKLNLDFIKLGPSTNSNDDISYLPFTDKVEADEVSKAITLDKAIPSKGEKVLIWYTNNGESAITDDIAQNIANDIDTIISDLEAEYGIPYKFINQGIFNCEAERKQLLKSMNISEDYYNKLNIYIFNNQEKPLTGGAYNYIYEDIDVNKTLVDSKIPGPYVYLNAKHLTDSKEIRLIYTHELFHQLQHNFLTNGNFDKIFDVESEKIINDKDFTFETTATLAAIKLNPNTFSETFVNGRIQNSLTKIETSINKIDGYESFRFLYNYENLVDNGKNIVRDSIKYPNRIKYLHESSNGKYDDIVAQYGYNSFLNNYGIESLKYKFKIDDKDSNITINPIRKNCINENCNSINPSSINYYSIKVNNYKEEEYIKIKSKDIDNMNVQFVGVKELTGVKWKEGVVDNNHVIEAYEYDFIKNTNFSSLEKDKYVGIKFEDFKDCDSVIVIVSNGNIDNSGNYEIIINGDSSNIEILNSTNVEDNKEEEPVSKPREINIYLDNADPSAQKKLNIESFVYNWRTYVNLKDFCNEMKCSIKQNETDKNKYILNRSYLEINSEKGESKASDYYVDFSLDNSVYNSKVNFTGNENDFFDLVQKDVTDKPCPTGKDKYGKLPLKICDENNIYVPIRFITQALGFIVDYNQTETENNVYLKDDVYKHFNDFGYKFVYSTDKVNIGEEVSNIIEINENKINKLEANKDYYVYVVDKENIRKFKSSFSFGNLLNEKDLSKGKYFEKISDNDFYGFKTSKTDSKFETLVLVVNYEIEPDPNNIYQTVNVNYPIPMLVNIEVE